jgi:nicotinamide-nucleotide adenylyltransferase
LETSSVYDLRTLFSLRESLSELDPQGASEAILIDSRPDQNAKRFGVLSGSFNPPTNAHIDLAARAREAFQLDCVLFLLSRVTIDKQENEGLSLEDRLLLLSLFSRELKWSSAAAANRGLYFEQAEALRRLLGTKAKLFFIVGMDKVAQIFDARYYRDRDEALVKLFIEAQLIAAGRERAGERELRELLARPENDNYADRVYFLQMPDETKQIASSSVRDRFARGEISAHDMPQIVAAFIDDTGAYRPAYELRRRLVERLDAIRESIPEGTDLRRLVALAGGATDKSRVLRDLLEDPAGSSAELRDFVSALES